jgi:predicted amidohydrolase
MEKELLKISLVQANTIQHDVVGNLAHLEEILEQECSAEADVIVLPEMFNTGFQVQPNTYAEPMGLHTSRWLKLQAARLNKAICGTFAVVENGKYYNRFIFQLPNGTFFQYDKHHLFSYGKEGEVYTAGNQQIIIPYLGWNIKPIICYEIRFPEWCRNTKTLEYDLILVCANWPAERSPAWRNLLPTRAIENSSYLVAVNRSGTELPDSIYNGGSAVYNPEGIALINPHLEMETVMEVELSKTNLKQYRNRFKVHLDWEI